MIPPIAPITIELVMLTQSALAVMATSPARTPLSIIERSGFFWSAQEVSIAVMHPAQAASVVVTKM